MGGLLGLISLFLVHNSFAAVTFDSARCASPAANEETLYSNEFAWGYTREAMEIRFFEIYKSNKRLPNRAYYDETIKSFVLPRKNSNGDIKTVKINPAMISSVVRHIEDAIAKGYAEYAFFPDMGHSHMYIPQEHWEAEFAPTPPVPEFHRLYEQMLNDPKTEFLYHTAEQLQMHDDDWNPLVDDYLLFRLKHRNPVGDNRGGGIIKTPSNPQSKANSVGRLEGYRSWSAGYNISSSHLGCFPYQFRGEVYYFDISLSDLEPDPGLPVSFGPF